MELLEKLILLEQNNERLHALLNEHFYQLEHLYEGISNKYQQFHQAIAHASIEDRAMLLMELSRQTINLYDQTEDNIQAFMQELRSEPASGFASMLLARMEQDPLIVFSKLHMS